MKQENQYDDSATIPIDKKQSNFTFLSGISVSLAVFAAQLIVGLLAATILGFTIGIGSANFNSIAAGVTLILSFPLAVLIVFRKRSLEAGVWDWKNSFWKLLPISFFMIFSASYIIGSLMELLPNYQAMLDQYQKMFGEMNTTLLLIGGGFIGPVCEEIIFRGIILKGFLNKYGYKKAIILSSLIFGVIHLVPIQMINAFFIGLILGYLYYKTRSLWLVSILHILNNIASFAISQTSMADATSRSIFSNDALYYGSFVFAALMVYSSYMLFERFHGPSALTEPEITA